VRVLTFCHNHPALHPGGTEMLALELHREMRRRGIDSFFLAGVDKLHRGRSSGTCFQTVGSSESEMLMWTGEFDPVSLAQHDFYGVFPELTDFLLHYRPTVVHFHHTLLVGVETIALVRRILPEAKIVLTLHDYYPLCPRDGILLNAAGERCQGPDIDSCRTCLPGLVPAAWRLRDLHIRNHLGLVHRFVCPSEFLRGRYLDWGLPAERMTVLRNGRPAAAPAPHRPLPADGVRNRFAIFGNLSRPKGTLVALRAAALLKEAGAEFSLTLHGAPKFQGEAFQAEFAKLLDQAGSRVVHAGEYGPAEIAGRMAAADWVVAPSIWWENAPLVIEEAFQHRRPVLCSGIGGMAERVSDGVDGLHFTAGDPAALAAAMRRGMDEPGLWERLAGGIRPAVTLTACADAHLALYGDLSGPAPASKPAARRPRATKGGRPARASMEVAS